MIRIATAFSGGLAAPEFSGGLAAPEFALKYEDLDHEVVFACEWDKYARLQYLEFHGEPKTFYNDISDLDARKYKDQIDLFIYGSPCQDLSLAGKRKGFGGEKSSLFRDGARVLSEMMPKVFVFENVKGLLSSNGGADYKEVVKTFQDIGYLIASKVVNAKEHGTAQNRERVFIVGFLDVEEYHNFSFAQPVKLDKTLRDYLYDKVDKKYTYDYSNSKSVKETIQNKELINYCWIDSYNRAIKTDFAGTLTTRVKESYQTHVFVNNILRFPTPTECFRLQGVKDKDIRLINEDTQSYKIAGNAIEVESMRSIIRQLYKPKKRTDTLF